MVKKNRKENHFSNVKVKTGSLDVLVYKGSLGIQIIIINVYIFLNAGQNCDQFGSFEMTY